MKRRSTGLAKLRMVDQLCEVLTPTLQKRLANHLPQKQQAEGLNLSNDAVVNLGFGK